MSQNWAPTLIHVICADGRQWQAVGYNRLQAEDYYMRAILQDVAGVPMYRFVTQLLVDQHPEWALQSIEHH